MFIGNGYGDAGGLNNDNVISGTGDIHLTGGGTLTLGNQGFQSTYVGHTFVDGGVLEYIPTTNGVVTQGLGSSAAEGGNWWQIGNGATIRFNEGPNASNLGTASMASTNRSITIGPGGGTVEVTAFTAAQRNSGGISGALGTTFTKTGAGEWWLRANDAGTIAAGTGNFSGNWVVAAGILDVTADTEFGVTTTSPNPTNVTIADQATLRGAATFAMTVNRGITLSGGTGFIGTANNSTFTIPGVITGPGALEVNISTPQVVNSGATLSGTVALQGANTYLGNTAVDAGATLQIGVGGPTGSINTNPVTNNGTLKFKRTDNPTFPNNISGSGGLIQIGTGTLALTGTNTYGGPKTVTSGTLQVIASAVPVNNAVTVTTGEYQMSGPGNYALSSLTINGGKAHLLAGRDKSLTLPAAPTIGATGQLDLEDSGMIINYGNQTTGATLANVRNLLINGRNAGPGAAAPWNGAGGITSTFAHNNGNGFNLAIGYADNAVLASINAAGSYTSFAGQTVASTTILVQMTYGADANLDGKVDGSDVSIIGTHFNQPGSGQWFFGDFDYSGSCDGADITVLGTTFGQTSPALSPAQLSAEFGSAFASAFESSLGSGGGGAAVPEPASLTLLGLGGMALISRRRKRKA